ncbi:MAG: ATP-binding cassette domain-containing protein [Candidatus Marsarchaeota archaeon]|nr:ATP-binding cassette domain-containing protein [Candidatus Marsarchaeota archaeon]MCL5094782.1 ATP-binding cassette domain-containing protein [Candidatus Marsarchaeota archaeon]
MNYIVEIRNLKKTFGNIVAVDDLSLNISKGTIFGILGPNGAGKTTTISTILGIEKQTSGKIIVNGLDNLKYPEKVKQIIGFMAQETIVDDELTGKQNLILGANLYHLPKDQIKDKVEYALKQSQLEKFADVKSKNYSGGMKRRLYLVKSMIHEPLLLILDEPTTGLDIQNRMQMWDDIRKLKKDGVTIIMTTQYLEEADYLCDTIAIIDHGKIKAIGSPSELKKQISSGNILEIILKNEYIEQITKLLKSEFNIPVSNFKNEKIEAIIEKNAFEIFQKILSEIKKKKIPILSISLRLPTMDDVFIKLTGSSIRDTNTKPDASKSNKFAYTR